MNRLTCAVVMCALMYVCSTASGVVLFFEDFESYDVGVSLHNKGGWEGWYDDAASATSVSNKYAYSGTKSIEIKSNIRFGKRQSLDNVVYMFEFSIIRL